VGKVRVDSVRPPDPYPSFPRIGLVAIESSLSPVSTWTEINIRKSRAQVLEGGLRCVAGQIFVSSPSSFS